MALRILDDRARVADQGGVNPQLVCNRLGAAIATAGAEDRPNTGPRRTRHRIRSSRTQCTVGVEERAVDIKRQ